MLDVIYLTFHDGISLETANRFMDVTAKAIQQYKPKQIHYLFSSGGGSVDSGVTMYNYLRSLTVKVVMQKLAA